MNSVNQYEQERHQLINQLLSEFPIDKSEQQKQHAVNEIAITILRSRPLCRRFNGMNLTGVYQEIYLQAKEKLIEHLSKYLFSFDSSQSTREILKIKELAPDHLYKLQTNIFKEILLDSCLKKMGLAAQKYLINSELRTYALTELIRAIKLSGRLCRPHIHKFSTKYYETLYEEAVNEILGYVCLNIDLYDPHRGQGKFMNWVNFRLDKTILKLHQKYYKYSSWEVSASQIFEQMKQPVNEPDLFTILQEYLIQDPEQVFHTTHVRDNPEASFSRIALAKFSGSSWSDISEQLDIPIPTLSSFYNRWCRRFTPLLETELKKYF
ncbi:MAG: hypothetical protein AAF383_16730 [Cyanobacteria bacterium P01_A01_bin.83]